MMDEFAKLGYANAVGMYQAFQQSERWHVLGFFDFCASKPAPGQGDLIKHMIARDWQKVARYYNGSGQVDEYAQRFERAYNAAVNLGLRK